jgi:hypothetical protein
MSRVNANGHIGGKSFIEAPTASVVVSGFYVAEDGSTFYVAENGTDNYVTES